MTILPEDDVLIDYRTSCTKDEAVAKMLGWMRGFLRKSIIELNTYGGIPEDELPHLSSFGGSIKKELIRQREAAVRELIDITKKDAIDDFLEKDAAVKKIDELIEKVGLYLAHIDDELARGESSALRIDKEATETSGTQQITLRSLDQWALSEYGISIGPFSAQRTAVNVPLQQQKYPAKEIQQIDDQSNQEEDWPCSIKAETFHTTFAFLVEAFAKTDNKYLKPDGTPNVSSIAKHLQEHARRSNQDCELPGQKYENIRKIISESIGIKKITLRKRGEGE